MENLVQLTYEYVEAFRNRDYEALDNLLAEDVNQVEPRVDIRGKATVLEFVKKMYDSVESINFVSTRVFASPEDRVSVIEFDVDVTTIVPQDSLSTVTFRGTDHLQWNREGKIEKIEAFLYQV